MSFLTVSFSLSASFFPLSLVDVTNRWARRRWNGTRSPPSFLSSPPPSPPSIHSLHSCTVSDFSSPLLGPFYALFPWCSDWCQGLVIWGNERLDGGRRVPLCLWHVSAERRCAALRWGPPFGRGHCWGCSLRSLSQPSFPFQSQPHECKNSGRKLITPRRGKVGARERKGKTERWRGERRGEWGAGGLFHPFCSSKSAPYFISLSLSPGFSNEWHYRQCHIQSDTNLFRLQHHSVFPQNQGRFVWGQFGFHKGFKWFLWR